MNTSNFDELNQQASANGFDTYKDPISGYQVLTSEALLKKGKCCGNSCRHCPFGYVNVEVLVGERQLIKQPVLINWVENTNQLDILFWSGGKDSFLTLMHLFEEKRNVVLLTSFGALTNRVSIQDVDIKDIAKQADFFKVPLCLVPLYPNTDYKERIEEAFRVIEEKTGLEIKRLVFGDLHLRDIKKWRVDTWSDYEVSTPLFDVSYEVLLKKLWKLVQEKQLAISLSTEIKLPHLTLPVGTPFDPDLVLQLELQGVDRMLENGEGHTLVLPKQKSQ
jgi:ATP-binding cassette subfamily B (MDR/TAP) protein 1